jgi:hypothetical protein
LVPSPDSSNDFVGVCGPSEWFGVVICLRDEAVDCNLEIDDGSEDAALELPLSEFAKKPSTALSHEHEVGVKWKMKREWRSSHCRTFGCLWAA